MKNRWIDAMKRGNSFSFSRPPPPPRQSSSFFSQSNEQNNTGPKPMELVGFHEDFVHLEDQCRSVGECTVASVLDQCVLQGGIHHTHVHLLSYLGQPLRPDAICYPVQLQWFRAFGEQNDFQVIPNANEEWLRTTADDIGARILVQIMIQDEDVMKTKMLEYGPIKEDPEVRSKVELYLERKSVLFMGLDSLMAQDGVEYPNNEELCESWTLLIDDKRVRLTCESALLPPFEGLYTQEIRMEILRETPNEFRLFLNDHTFVQLRARSHIVRDTIVLTVRAFCKDAIASRMVSDAVSKGISPMLTIRNLQHAAKGVAQESNVSCYDLPWNRAVDTKEERPTMPDRRRSSIKPVSDSMDPSTDADDICIIESPRSRHHGSSSASTVDEVDDSLLLDAEALIGNAMQMGIQHQILPPIRKRISMAEIPDLQIVDACIRQRRTSSSMIESTDLIYEVPVLKSTDEDEGISTAIRKFEQRTLSTEASEVDALRSEYSMIFCAMQAELRQYKDRVTRLSKRLEERDEENSGFRRDIDVLRHALGSMELNEQCKQLRTELPLLMAAVTAESEEPDANEPLTVSKPKTSMMTHVYGVPRRKYPSQ